MTAWVSSRGEARHDERVMVSTEGGNSMVPDTAAVAAIRTQPCLIGGRLDAGDITLVAGWITLNRDALMAMWNGEIDGVELGQRLQKIG